MLPRRVWNREDLRTKLVVLGPPLGPNADRRNEVGLGFRGTHSIGRRRCNSFSGIGK
jgi:hypothetical protein